MKIKFTLILTLSILCLASFRIKNTGSDRPYAYGWALNYEEEKIVVSNLVDSYFPEFEKNTCYMQFEQFWIKKVSAMNPNLKHPRIYGFYTSFQDVDGHKNDNIADYKRRG